MSSLSEIATHLGISKSRAGQFSKEEGMPVDSLEAAERWREAREMKRQPTNGKAPKKIRQKTGRPHRLSEPSDTGDSLEDSLKDAICVAKDAFRAYQSALSAESSSTSVRLSEFNKALRGRQDAERLYREEVERRGLLVPKLAITEICRRCMDAVLTRLRKIPNELGPKCNPQNSIMAVEILDRKVQEIMAAGQAAINDL